MNNLVKKALVAGAIGLAALGATSFAPDADAQDASTDQGREDRQEKRETRRAERVATLTDALGVDEDALRAAREAGQSLAAIAIEQGVAVDVVVDALVDAKTTRIQDRVTAGDLTQAEADERIAGLEDRITERVNTAPGERGERSERGRRGHRGPARANTSADF